MTTIPITVVAKNEARALARCLESLSQACEHATAELGLAFDRLVVADDCRDDTVGIARSCGWPVVTSTGGKVSAQLRGVRPGPFVLFSDADLRVEPDTVTALCEAMLRDPSLQVAMPPKVPVPPRRRTVLAHALHLYNLRRGHSSQRTWFSGKLFAIRRYEMPSVRQMKARAEALPDDRFYDYAAGMRIDDIYLSRVIVRDHGLGSIVETSRGQIWFRAPETFVGMYRYYRRMRMELERLDRLFPETRAVHRRHGRRRPDLLASAPARERMAWQVFEFALRLCKVLYFVERHYYQRISRRPCDPWPVVEETKEPPWTVHPR
ncbi:MAG: glycosyltransferase [Myxococcota bacterium]